LYLSYTKWLMEADKNEWRILQRALTEWEREGKLAHEQAEELKKSIHFRKTESQQIARYFFFIALSCALLAFGAIFINDKLLEKIKAYFSLNNAIIALLSAALAIAWFWYVRKRGKELTTGTYESYMILGALPVLTALVYICKDTGAGNAYTLFLFAAFAVLIALGIWFRSTALWIIGILALMGWFGAFSTWQSTNYLFLGMNYPVRFAVFGLLIIGLSYLQLLVHPLYFTQRVTFIVGLLIFFTAMWGVSIFGNFNYLDEWEKVRQTHVLAYAILFGAAAIISFMMGIRYRDEAARDFGILFLLVNLYTRYFEFFWDTMNKGIFFLILAVTFGLLGRWLEKKKRSAKTNVQRQP
jgi:uncharacterized membrane protein